MLEFYILTINPKGHSQIHRVHSKSLFEMDNRLINIEPKLVSCTFICVHNFLHPPVAEHRLQNSLQNAMSEFSDPVE